MRKSNAGRRLSPALFLPALAASFVATGAFASGQHGDSCPYNCMVRDHVCREECKKDAACLEHCGVEQEHCKPLCRALVALANDPKNYQKKKEFAEARKKKEEALDALWAKQHEREEKARRRRLYTVEELVPVDSAEVRAPRK